LIPIYFGNHRFHKLDEVGVVESIRGLRRCSTAVQLVARGVYGVRTNPNEGDFGGVRGGGSAMLAVLFNRRRWR
jgi:hypothetical protein